MRIPDTPSPAAPGTPGPSPASGGAAAGGADAGDAAGPIPGGWARVRPSSGLRGDARVPGDKSISHRAALLASVARGRTVIDNYSPGEDCAATLRCIAALGAVVERDGPARVAVTGVGGHGFRSPGRPLDAGNSGTTLRLLLGLLAGQPVEATLTGDASLRRRPMARVVEPLRRMGATITGPDGGARAPLTVRGGALRGITHHSPIASAQVKSALLLAGLFARGTTAVTEPALSRDHTERILPLFGVRVEREGLRVAVEGGQEVRACPRLAVPGDLSAAAFYLAAGALCPDGEVTVRGVGVNPTRTGFLEVLAAMGARVEIRPATRPEEPAATAWEPVADVTVRPGPLQAVDIGGESIPRLIDEIPVLAVLATQARGVTRIRDAAELRVKETDRLRAVAEELRRLGADVEEFPDGLAIRGPVRLRGATCSARGDHRMAMALAVAGLVAEGETVIEGAGAAAVSDPTFFHTLRELGARVDA